MWCTACCKEGCLSSYLDLKAVNVLTGQLSISQTFFCLWPPSELDSYVCPPSEFDSYVWPPSEHDSYVWPPSELDSYVCTQHPTLSRRCCLWKEVTLFIKIYVYFMYIYCVVFKYSMYDTLFTCTHNNNLLTIGFIFSVFLGSDEHCNVVCVLLQCGQWQATQRQGSNLLLTTIKSPNRNQIQPIRSRKSNKMQLCLLFCGVCRVEGNLWINFKFEVFYSGSKISVTHSEVTVAPKIFRHSPVAS